MKFIQCQWCEEAEYALGDLITERRASLLDDIERGNACLWRIVGDGESWQTWLITRVEFYSDGTRELVLEAVRGRHVVAVVNTIKRRLDGLGVGSMRFATPHTDKAVGRLLRGTGFERIETHYRLSV